MSLLDDLRRRQALQDIPIDTGRIEVLLDDADRHLRSGAAALDIGDLAGAYQLAYDAARKALTAALAARGLRTRGQGAHANLISLAQAGELGGDTAQFEPLDRMRQTRNHAEYDGYRFDTSEVTSDLATAARIVEQIRTTLPPPPTS